MENGDDPQMIERALYNMEQAMRTYEHDHGHLDTSSKNIRRVGQIRYHNTLYLYNGMFFEKQRMYLLKTTVTFLNSRTKTNG